MNASPSIPPFHLAFPVRDLDEARDFYVSLLGCGVGRSTTQWVDFNFFGHQLVAHLCKQAPTEVASSSVDGKQVPASHFGAVVSWDAWESMAETLRSHRVPFVIEPHVRFMGLPGEHATMFFCDPSGNAIEMKSFKDLGQLFAE